ncbi:MAG TPA: GNAT family N-acetyltransferase [Caulobacteraceae bacterium]|nr:GNAT family N-acetyltransferase [Caulobacteraceae bacterium]
MSRITARDYAGPHDLRVMQDLTQRLWSLDERHMVGGLAWQRYEHVGDERLWRTRLWEADGRVVAWGWVYERDPDLLYLQAEPGRQDLIDEVLAWFEGAAASEAIVVDVSDRQSALIAALQARRYAPRADGPFGLLTSRSLETLPPLQLPPGLIARSVAQAPDPDRRAAAHRAAWSRIAGRENDPPGASGVTGESYRNVMAAWPYRPELDWVLEAPDGRWVANCCIWLDETNAVGELEPVGVDAEFRRRGLGRAVCLAALHALRQSGATTAIVGARGDDAYPVPRKLYFGLGFAPYARTIAFERERLA